MKAKSFYETLTLEMLKDKSACNEQVDLFRSMFGNSVAITPELCVSVADKFDFTWAAQHLLSPARLPAYRLVEASALADYGRVTKSALADYERAKESAWADYRLVEASALDDYERVTASALADFRRVTARTFGELFCKEE